jgi:Leucine-rich repeat (LRR) protein
LEITNSFLGIYEWEPDIHIGFSPALYLQWQSSKRFMGELAGPAQERLEELHLSGNRILRLPGQSLSGLRSLALLNVSLNRLSLLDTFPKVKQAKRSCREKRDEEEEGEWGVEKMEGRLG